MDLISRQAAIKKLESGKDKKAKGEIGGFYNQIIENDIEKLKKLPSVQTEADCQKCIFRGFAGFKQFQTAQPEERCGECDAWNQYKNYARGMNLDDALIQFGDSHNFCPNCGADMRGKQDGKST